MESQNIEIVDWGRLPYGPAFERQKTFVEERQKGIQPDRLVMVEHPPVVTIGRSGNQKDVCLPDEMLRQRGVELYYIDRGGRATYHGPGQMVAYPIIKIKNQDLHWYVRTLLETAASVLREYGLQPTFKKGNPGIWVDGKKIASIGIAVKKWITYHGVALNVNPDLSAFDWIVPCGHPDEIMTSMENELGQPVDLIEVKRHFIHKFCEYFGYPISPKQKHPKWLKLPSPATAAVEDLEHLLTDLRLATVCQSAHCPNIGECFNRGTATFMILGTRCTRNCRFCAVDSGFPEPLDPEEPVRVAKAAQHLGLKYVVITSVTRDDLEDGGAEQFVRTIEAIRRSCPDTKIEVLVPDFKGSLISLQNVCKARPDMFNHNIETVPRLYPLARPQARFERSLKVLKFAAGQGLKAKSGMMLGLGEQPEEIIETLLALRRIGCNYLTLGQYLSPSKDHVPVARYVQPEEFDMWAEKAKAMGFMEVAAGPMIRSSYKAEEMVKWPGSQSKVKAVVPIDRKQSQAAVDGMAAKGLCVSRFGPDCDQTIVGNAALTVSANK
jgi:lipoic acid synthetase